MVAALTEQLEAHHASDERAATRDLLTQYLESDKLQFAGEHTGPTGATHDGDDDDWSCACSDDAPCACYVNQQRIIDTLRRDLGVAAEVGRALLHRHEEFVTTSEETEERMLGEIRDLRNELEGVNEENAKLLGDNAALMEELHEASEALVASDSRLDSIHTELGQAKERIARLNLYCMQTQALEDEIAILEQVRDGLQTELAASNKNRVEAEKKWRKTERLLEKITLQYERLATELSRSEGPEFQMAPISSAGNGVGVRRSKTLGSVAKKRLSWSAAVPSHVRDDLDFDQWHVPPRPVAATTFSSSSSGPLAAPSATTGSVAGTVASTVAATAASMADGSVASSSVAPAGTMPTPPVTGSYASSQSKQWGSARSEWETGITPTKLLVERRNRPQLQLPTPPTSGKKEMRLGSPLHTRSTPEFHTRRLVSPQNLVFSPSRSPPARDISASGSESPLTGVTLAAETSLLATVREDTSSETSEDNHDDHDERRKSSDSFNNLSSDHDSSQLPTSPMPNDQWVAPAPPLMAWDHNPAPLKKSASHESIFSNYGAPPAPDAPKPLWKISAGGTAQAQVSVEKMHAAPFRSGSVASKALLSAAVSQNAKRNFSTPAKESGLADTKDNNNNNSTPSKSWASSLLTRFRGGQPQPAAATPAKATISIQNDTKDDDMTHRNDPVPTANVSNLLADALASNIK